MRRKSSSCGLDRPWWCKPCLVPWVPRVGPPTPSQTLVVTKEPCSLINGVPLSSLVPEEKSRNLRNALGTREVIYWLLNTWEYQVALLITSVPDSKAH
jgi:hypothetical protein